MSIIQGTVAMGRRWAESRMTDTCVVEKITADVLDEVTGKRETVTETVYEGPCEFKAAALQATETELAGQLLVTQRTTLKLPIATSVAVTKGHVVTITASQSDPGLVGVRATIVGPFAASFTTARRFPVKVVT